MDDVNRDRFNFILLQDIGQLSRFDSSIGVVLQHDGADTVNAASTAASGDDTSSLGSQGERLGLSKTTIIEPCKMPA
ncbi:hypothetical protein [Rhizobium leguminosarum]|uniref:hypothetical protein n=1 Tax=Rhizobium leguminosarum TaxID=384 RepID=UPI001C9195CB|nr:hypothetical protein [Rhizobium leguminosarum]MBY2951704.1 hypothetical protein [Rhizobium leguminosarum]